MIPAYVINLKHRTDRREAMEKQLEGRGFDVQWVPGVQVVAKEILPNEARHIPKWRSGVRDQESYLNGVVGSLRAHRNTLLLGYARGDDAFLVLEDDLVFAPNFNDNFARTVKCLPLNYHALYLDALHITPTLPLQQLDVLTKSYLLTGTLWSRGGAWNAYQILEKGGNETDVLLALHLHPQGLCFSTRPLLAGHAEGYSDIRHNNEVYQSGDEYLATKYPA